MLVPHDYTYEDHGMHYTYRAPPFLSDNQRYSLRMKIDRLHHYHMGLCMQLVTKLKGQLREARGVDVAGLLTDHDNQLRRYAAFEHLDADMLSINDERLWRAEQDRAEGHYLRASQ